MKTQAIIVAGGVGTRLKANKPKPLVKLGSKPLFIHTLEAISQSDLISSIILVVSQENGDDFREALRCYGCVKDVQIVLGGQERQDSVRNGLKFLDEDTQVVLIHDAARPFVSQDIIEKSICACQEHEAVIVGVPVKPTIKQVDLKTLTVEATLNRAILWEVQTPQVFRRDVIVQAHEQSSGSKATDDAALVEAMGRTVKVLQGDYRNIKITTQEDLQIAQGLFRD